MKYESSILKRLIDTYGVIGNPRYLSEIIKEFIVRGKELYPQLFTYQSDWLAHIDEFGLTPEYTVSYTGQHIYAPNTKEKPVKSAILKGNTLVNILPSVNDDRFLIRNSTTLERLEDGFLRINAPHKGGWEIATNTIPIKPSTKYLLITEVKNNTVDGLVTLANVTGFTANNLTKVSIGFNGVLKQIITTKDVLSEYVFQGWLDSGSSGFVDIRNTLIEYQDGMENWDIPYFEGMQSVKLPVLTTTGKNLFDSNLVKSENNLANVEHFDDGIKITSGRGGVVFIQSDNFYLKNNTTYTISALMTKNIGSPKAIPKIRVAYYDDETNKHKTIGYCTNSSYTFNTGNNTRISLGFYSSDDFDNGAVGDSCTYKNIQLEEGSQATSYEPHKSNILTTPSDLTLRGIGDVKDTLDCLTGKVVQKFTTKTYNGSENWALHAASSKLVNCLHFYVNENDIKRNGKAISPQIKTLNYSEVKDDEYISIGGSQHLHYKVDKNKLTSQDVNGFKQWLSQNPFTVQYQLATESIKTVDLTIHDKDHQKVERLTSFEGGTHFTTSSQDGSLLPTLTVDVVTNLEETLMVCSIEGNTM